MKTLEAIPVSIPYRMVRPEKWTASHFLHRSQRDRDTPKVHTNGLGSRDKNANKGAFYGGMHDPTSRAALPVGLHQEAGWQLQELVVLHVQHLHGGALQPLGQPRQLVVSCQQLPETAVTEQAVPIETEKKETYLELIGIKMKK